jgi:hypothetical protein
MTPTRIRLSARAYTSAQVQGVHSASPGVHRAGLKNGHLSRQAAVDLGRGAVTQLTEPGYWNVPLHGLLCKLTAPPQFVVVVGETTTIYNYYMHCCYKNVLTAVASTHPQHADRREQALVQV